MKQPLMLTVLQCTLHNLKMKTSTRPNGICNEMLTHLGSAAVKKHLEIFNHSWETGSLPQILQETIMIPIHKKGKNPKNATSYRPISLTSCRGKTMKRIVNEHLRSYLENSILLAPKQVGFRQFHCTEEQTTYLFQENEDAFQEQKLVSIENCISRNS